MVAWENLVQYFKNKVVILWQNVVMPSKWLSWVKKQDDINLEIYFYFIKYFYFLKVCI